jgi:hypothetical protein
MYTAAGTYRIFFIITFAQPMKYCGCLLFCCPVVCPSVATLFLFENIDDQTMARMYLMNIFKWPLTICEGVKREKKKVAGNPRNAQFPKMRKETRPQFHLNVELLE